MAVAVGELWETAEHAIATYTGLSPAVFFTVLALGFAFYYVIAGFFQPAAVPRKRELEFEKMEPLPPPVQLGEVTEEELRAYDGTDSVKPLLMAIKGQIYDVTQSRMFYGPGGPYALFAGKDASRALAKMSFEQQDLTGDISGLNPFELEALQDWEYKFMGKYVKVGTIKTTVPVADGSLENTSETTATSDETTEGGSAAATTTTTTIVTETQAGHGAEAVHSSEPKDDGPAEHGDKAAGHGAEAELSAEVEPQDGKEAGSGDVATE